MMPNRRPITRWDVAFWWSIVVALFIAVWFNLRQWEMARPVP